MTKDEAQRLASGYAWAYEDATGTPTVTPAGKTSGDFEFALAYATAQDAYNAGQRGSFMPVRDAYQRWQQTRGRTIESETDERLAMAKLTPDDVITRITEAPSADAAYRWPSRSAQPAGSPTSPRTRAPAPAADGVPARTARSVRPAIADRKGLWLGAPRSPCGAAATGPAPYRHTSAASANPDRRHDHASSGARAQDAPSAVPARTPGRTGPVLLRSGYLRG